MSVKPNLNRDIGSVVSQITRLSDRILPIKVGRMAVNHVKDNFRNGGYDGQTWKEPYRRRLSFSGAQGSYGTLLSGTNHLRDSTDMDPQRGRVRIFNDVQYATVHNDGATITVTAKMKKYFWYRHIQSRGALRKMKSGKLSQSRRNQSMSRESSFWLSMAVKPVGSKINMPKRRFMGIDKELKTKINQTINKELEDLIHGIYTAKSH